MSESGKIETIPPEFQKIIKDFISDILNTFPEYKPIISKWWPETGFSLLSEEEQNSKMKFIFGHCRNIFPERFFDILYQNEDIFSDSSSVNTDFLPGVSFKYLWKCEISSTTRETIWKYLQLILLALVGSLDNKDAFGDTAKLFESINENEFKEKLEETLENMQKIFESSDANAAGPSQNASSKDDAFNGVNMENLPNAEQIHDHITGILGGKLGQLAKEIAEETATNLNMDMENVTDAKDVFQNLFKNPGKLMDLVKNVGGKLDERIKSGEIKESELYSEATELMNKMKDMPGMNNIQSMLKSMGMTGGLPNMGNLGRNARVDVNAMQEQFKRMEKNAKMKERMKQNMEMKHSQKLAEEFNQKVMMEARIAEHKNAMNDDDLVAFIGEGDKTETKSKKTGKKKKGKK